MEFSLHVKTKTSETLSVKTFEPEPGLKLTAFFAKISMRGRLADQSEPSASLASEPLGYFRDFAVTSVGLDDKDGQKVDDVVTKKQIDHMIPVHRTTLAPMEMMLRHQGGFAIAAADLSKIKRIRVCVGGKGEEPNTTMMIGEPSKDMITGIWLEYHDSHLPVILGQWKEEIGSIEISVADRLVAIQIWHDFDNGTDKRRALGRVAGILFRTASGTEKKFARRYVVERNCISFRGNRYEEIVSEPIVSFQTDRQP